MVMDQPHRVLKIVFKIFCRIVVKDNVGCPKFHIVSYTTHKFVTCTLDVDNNHSLLEAKSIIAGLASLQRQDYHSI